MTVSIVSDAVVGPCKDCGRIRVHQKAYNRAPHWRAEGFVRNASFDMCNGCYGRAKRAGSLPNIAPAPRPWRLPEIRLTVTYALTCEVCGVLPAASDRETNLRLRAEHVQMHRRETVTPPQGVLGAIA